jgi:predicted transcriptional regulator
MRLGGKVVEAFSDDLRREVQRLAEEQGRSEIEVVEEAVRSYVLRLGRVRNPEFLFDRIDQWQREQGVAPLSEEDVAMLANDELHAMRLERRAGR